MLYRSVNNSLISSSLVYRAMSIMAYTAMSMAILGCGSYPDTSKSSNWKSSIFSTCKMREGQELGDKELG